MPRGDGTGPMGGGAMTGRGLGVCGTGTVVRGANPAGGCGMGRGRGGSGMGLGRGLGLRNRSYTAEAAITPEDEKNIVANDIKALEAELKAAKKRADELNG